MKNLFLPVFCLTLASCSTSGINEEDIVMSYKSPANATKADQPLKWSDDSEWIKALPLGNGSLGGMVYGDVYKERVQLNEESMWTGSYQESNNPEAKKHLNTIRQLLFEGNYKEATKLCSATQICKGEGTGRAYGAELPYGSFQMLGDLWLDFDNKSPYVNYERSLNLSKGVAHVSYTQNDVNYTREYFTSYPDQVMAIHLSADKAQKISFTATMTRPERFHTYTEGEELVMSGALSDGKGGDGLEYMSRLKAIAKGGNITYSDSIVRVEAADEVTLLLTASTDYVMDYPIYKGRNYKELTDTRIDKASTIPFEKLKANHVNDYRALFERSNFTLGNSAKNTLPTDSLVMMAKKGKVDNRLHELLFHYGKYLLISSSREGTLPANLQGIWTNKLNSPWNGDFHTDINIQMNYWPAEVTNLAELHIPYFDLLSSITEPGRKTAQEQYGMNGWVVHPVTNVWGFTSPGERISWGMHAGATAWMCQHIAEHYRFTGDMEFLKKMYPVLKGAIEFYMDWLVKDPKTGKYVSGPAVSPENQFYAPDGSTCHISMAPSHDQQVIGQLFYDFLQISKVLGVSDDFVTKAAGIQKELATCKIGEDGRLMEWNENFKEYDPGHRHLSHMFALYPGAYINQVQTPELLEAASKSLECRVKHGLGHVGWSAAWLTNLYARLHEGEKALNSINGMFKRNMAVNLFSLGKPFQIEAGFGATAGIAEMILQSHIYEDDSYIIQILPALPKAWSAGSFSRLKARGGFEISASWEGGQLKALNVTSLLGKKCRIMYGDKELFQGAIQKGSSWNL